MIRLIISFSVAIFLGINGSSSIASEINVKDFGAFPNDSKDDTAAIRKAFDHAVSNKINIVKFEAGTYNLKAEHPKGKLLKLSEAENLTLEGAVDKDGKPATEFLRFNYFINKSGVPGILSAFKCNKLTLKNLIFDNKPNHASSGKVVELGKDYVIVEVFEGLPRVDGMACFCANAWDLNTGRLKKVPSLTFGSSPANWKNISGGNGRRIRIDKIKFAKYLEVGDGMSWWISHWGRQLRFELCRDLTIENIRVKNAAGFAIEAFRCTNIKGYNVVFKPEGKQLPLSPRDAWKLAWCDGIVTMDKLHVEGVRWDGQNVHGPWLRVVKKISPKTVMLVKRSGEALSLKDNSVLGFFDKEEKVQRKIVSWKNRGYKYLKTKWGKRRDAYIEVKLEEAAPDFIKPGTLCMSSCTDIDKYVLKNSTFKNIAGCGSIIKNEHVTVDNCVYEDIMYPAILLGVEEYESTFPRNVIIKNTTIRSSGWIPRIGIRGAIGIGCPVMKGIIGIKNIVIEKNTIENCDLGLRISDCQDVLLKWNKFINVKKAWWIDPKNTKNIVNKGNKFIK